jgi:hypothetical protein
MQPDRLQSHAWQTALSACAFPTRRATCMRLSRSPFVWLPEDPRPPRESQPHAVSRFGRRWRSYPCNLWRGRNLSACLPWPRCVRHARLRPVSHPRKLDEPGSRYHLSDKFVSTPSVTKLYVGNLPFTATDESQRSSGSRAPGRGQPGRPAPLLKPHIRRASLLAVHAAGSG